MGVGLDRPKSFPNAPVLATRAETPPGHLASRLHGNGRPLDLPKLIKWPNGRPSRSAFAQGPVQAVCHSSVALMAFLFQISPPERFVRPCRTNCEVLQVRLPSFQPHWTSAPIPRSPRPALRRGRVCGGNGRSMREVFGEGDKMDKSADGPSSLDHHPRACPEGSSLAERSARALGSSPRVTPGGLGNTGSVAGGRCARTATRFSRV